MVKLIVISYQAIRLNTELVESKCANLSCKHELETGGRRYGATWLGFKEW